MNFPVNAEKATDAYVRLLMKEGGKADHLRLAKLIYLSDRKSLVERGVPIVGGTYFSMRKGPMISETTNFVARLDAPGWKEHISPRKGHQVALLRASDLSHLSKAEIEILDATAEEHKDKTTEELTHWCHEHCSEYESVIFGRRPISVEKVLAAESKSAEKIAKLVKQAKADLELENLLAGL